MHCVFICEKMNFRHWGHVVSLIPISARFIGVRLNTTKRIQVLIEVSFVHNIVRSLLPNLHRSMKLWYYI